jgi:predicted flavoprotein YhiN
MREYHSPSDEVTKALNSPDEERVGSLSRRIWQYLVQKSGISPDAKWESLSKADVNKLSQEVTAGKYMVDGMAINTF